MKKFIEIIKKKWLRDTTKTILLVAILFAAYIGINVLVENVEIKDIDVTEDQLFTLSEQSINQARNVTEDIKIYLIGVDHHFQISQNNKGEIIVDNSVKDYFCDEYNEDKDNLYIPNLEKSTLTYLAMKKNCEERGLKVYNATRGGKLEVFKRVDFDSLF